MNRVLVKNFSLIGLHWGLYFKMNPGVIQQAQEAIVRLHAEGRISPLVSATYPLSEAKEALAELGGRKTTGKVVLIP
jgi:NADPH2:quinone reductase